MSGYGRVVVGYRFNDRRRFLLDGQEGGMVRGGRCISCGADTFSVLSGQAAIRDRDAQIACDDCYQQHKHLMQAEL